MIKNLGQVAGLFIGTSAPQNTTLIWYDSASHVHKVYNTDSGTWGVLDQTIISPVTYGELVTRAEGVGLTQGQWFRVTDKSNCLALAITSTKIQYADNSGALVIDDLGTNINYHVTSGNLLIDDISGVYDVSTGKLVFSFQDATPNFTTGSDDIDYVMGIRKTGNNRSTVKFRLSSLLSNEPGNDISWNDGFFFSLITRLRSYYNRQGGVVSWEQYNAFVQNQELIIQQLGQAEMDAINTISQTLEDLTTAAVIYAKKLPQNPDISANPDDVVAQDTLSTIISKFQSWINKFKNSDGIKVGSGLNIVDSAINANDTVKGALGKAQGQIDAIKTGMTGETIAVGTSSLSPQNGAIVYSDTLKTAVEKLLFQMSSLTGQNFQYWSIDVNKIAVGVLPTDIARFDISVTWPGSDASYIMGNLGVGAILKASNTPFFAYSPGDPTNPYAFANNLWMSPECPIIGFAPVMASMVGGNNGVNIAMPISHFTGYYMLDPWSEEGERWVGAGLQIQFLLAQALYSALTSAGMAYMKVVISSFNIYGNAQTMAQTTYYIGLNRVNIFELNLAREQFTGTAKNIVMGLSVSFTATNA